MVKLHGFAKKLQSKKLSFSKIFACLDLTSLNATDSDESIIALCHKATNSLGSVAAVCCYPQFVKTARAHLSNEILVATVVDFPDGKGLRSDVEAEVKEALNNGADEIDLVSRNPTMVKAVKALCAHHSLKVIIESGTLEDPALIYKVSLELLHAGADFIKTSTGKVPVGATLEAANAILQALKQFEIETGYRKGIKISGGVRTLAQAEAFIALAEQAFGSNYITPKTFRIGASALLDELLALQS